MAKWQVGDKTFDVSLNVHVMRRVQRDLNLDLSFPAGADVVTRLLLDLDKTADVLWAAIELEAVGTGLSYKDYLGCLNGESLQAGWRALADAWLAFVPPNKRKVAQDFVDAQVGAIEAAISVAAEALNSREYRSKLDEIVAATRREMLAALAKPSVN